MHNKAINKKDQGSKNKGLVYVDFQTGVFEAMKEHFLNFLDIQHNTKLISDPVMAKGSYLYDWGRIYDFFLKTVVF